MMIKILLVMFLIQMLYLDQMVSCFYLRTFGLKPELDSETKKLVNIVIETRNALKKKIEYEKKKENERVREKERKLHEERQRLIKTYLSTHLGSISFLLDFTYNGHF
jgi:hypothetical protein